MSKIATERLEHSRYFLKEGARLSHRALPTPQKMLEEGLIDKFTFTALVGRGVDINAPTYLFPDLLEIVADDWDELKRIVDLGFLSLIATSS